jgi:Cu/Ag efflux protein CusF
MKSRLALISVVAGLIAATAAVCAPAQEPNPPAKISVYSGILQSIDKQARVIAVEHTSLSQKFVVPTDAQIIVKDKAHADLSDLMVGDNVEVKYTDDDGLYIAHQISVLGARTP